MEERLKISEPVDWYRVGTRQLEDIKCTQGVQGMGGLLRLLQKYYAGLDWDAEMLTNSGKKSGTVLLNASCAEGRKGGERGKEESGKGRTRVRGGKVFPKHNDLDRTTRMARTHPGFISKFRNF
jgi:hypothetical protein